MTDLSEEGLFVQADLPVLTGEPVIVSFRAPLAHAWIDAEASVARVVHGRRAGDRGRGLGLVFERLEGGADATLREQLRWFSAARGGLAARGAPRARACQC